MYYFYRSAVVFLRMNGSFFEESDTRCRHVLLTMFTLVKKQDPAVPSGITGPDVIQCLESQFNPD
jgi:hypothetical protein